MALLAVFAATLCVIGGQSLSSSPFFGAQAPAS